MPNPIIEEEQDNIEAMNRKDTEHKLPIGWVVFFLALIVWGIYYYIAYTPSISGWTQSQELEQVMQNK